MTHINLESIAHPHGSYNYYGKVARTKTEALELVKSGFNYVYSLREDKLFQKTKQLI